MVVLKNILNIAINAGYKYITKKLLTNDIICDIINILKNAHIFSRPGITDPYVGENLKEFNYGKRINCIFRKTFRDYYK